MAFTSIKTAGGWSTNAVQAAYSTLFGWDLKAAQVWEPLVDFTPKQVATRGSSITVQLNAYYSAADVIAATTADGDWQSASSVRSRDLARASSSTTSTLSCFMRESPAGPETGHP